MEAGLFTTTKSSSMWTMRIFSDETGTSCLQQRFRELVVVGDLGHVQFILGPGIHLNLSGLIPRRRVPWIFHCHANDLTNAN